MYTENDKSYRKTYLVKEIQRDKEKMTKDIAFLGASALAIGVGVLGVSLLGDDVINAFTSKDALTFNSFFVNQISRSWAYNVSRSIFRWNCFCY